MRFCAIPRAAGDSSRSLGLDPELLTQAQSYLGRRRDGTEVNRVLECRWAEFHKCVSDRIRRFAYRCGASSEDIGDCAQDVWAELIRRLPSFRLDATRGRFDSWLFQIVRSKTCDLRRGRKRNATLCSSALVSVAESRESAIRALEDSELFKLALNRMREYLSECNFRIVRMRLIEGRPVADVARSLGMTNEQIWYRYHRSLRAMEAIGKSVLNAWAIPQRISEKTNLTLDFAQGPTAESVSPSVNSNLSLSCGGNCVDYVFQRLELGRREVHPEWKVEWKCDPDPSPTLHVRHSAVVAFAEICGPSEVIGKHWPSIVNSAIAAGVAAGIATIIATPSAALPVFQAEFRRQLHAKVARGDADNCRIALSARQEPNGPWRQCD